jgi:protease-4
MIAFLRWLRSILAAVLNGFAKFVFALLLLFLALMLIGLARGDGHPDSMVLTLDLRRSLPDSVSGPRLPWQGRNLSMMDLLFSLDTAGRDKRVKGVTMRLGGGLSIAQAEELSAALTRFKAKGKFVVAQATSFFGAGMGDYLAASAADQIWVQPKSDFAVAGAGAGEIFLRGLFDKIHAEPQIAKRADYKSAADMYMEKTMTGPDREQLTALLQSWYQSAVTAAATARHLTPEALKAAFDASPQFSEEAKAKGLIDKLGYDDDALAAAIARGGADTKAVKIGDYDDDITGVGANVAVIEAAGEISDGTAQGDVFSGSSGIASDDLSAAIRQAAAERGIKAIVLRVDSPGGSVTASDQILDAVKKAQAKGKPVVVSMAGLAASGGYYISASANKIVAEPGTLTGSIGVLTGKVSVGKSLDLIGVGFNEVSVGKNTLMDSGLTPYTPEQWAALNHTADVIYDDFLHKVAAGRKMTVAQVGEVAKGRVWTGADAKTHGLVDELGGFWTATALAAKLGGVPADQAAYRIYPRRKSLLEGLGNLAGMTGASLRALEGLQTLTNLPGIRILLQAVAEAPRGQVEYRAVGLPQGK